MSTKSFRSQPLPSVSRPLSCATDFWVAQQKRQQKRQEQSLVWGRIQDNGCNFIVEGWRFWENGATWVKIPCQNLPTAQLLLCSVMNKQSFKAEQLRQAWDKMERDGKSYNEIIEKLGY